MKIELVTKEDLQLFKQELLAEFKLLLANNKKQPVQEKDWVKSREVKKLLDISPGKLHTLRLSGKLPFVRLGGLMYYQRSDVLGLFENKDKR